MRRKSTIPELQELYTKWETKRNIIHERQYIDSKELKQVNSNLSNITYKIKKLKLSDCQCEV